MADPYQPINCNFYDRLEALATLRKTIDLSYLDEEGVEQQQEGVLIQDLQTKEGVEYGYFSSGLVLRLDRILKVS